MKIASYAVKHPVVIGMLVIALVAFGFYCVFGMNLEFLPDISMPEVEVVTIYPGASAEDVEKDITKILEDDFATLPNYKSMTSQSMNSMSWITITYSDGVDPYEQLTDLRYRISQLKDDLPEDAQEPVSIVGGASMLPIMTFAVKGGSDTSRIKDYIEDTLKPRLTRIDGVSEISVYGASELEIQVKLRMDDIQSKGISVLQVYQVLNYSDRSIPLGNAEYRGKMINVKYDGSISDIEQLKELPVGATSEGTIIRLSDVADVQYGYKKQDVRIMDESSNVIMVTVSKRASGNTVKICRQIRSVLDGIASDTDGALTCKIFSDDSKSVKNSLSNVLGSGILGVLIAVAVIFLFLNDGRSTLVIGISIPLSVLFTFIAMKLTGSTINLMTTASFVVALGMIVDGSICMIEQISRYLGKDGYTTLQAIERGSSEVGPSITASVLTTVVVFLPICFLKGIMGMILTGFAQVLIFCMLASLLVSVVIVPWLMSLISMIHVKHRDQTFFMKAVDKLEALYRRGLSWSLKHKTYVILVPIFMLVLAAGMVTGLGYSFIPSVD
ncbi:MAG: efflux RND transporter permease subunit, partial [Spirochaetales bacterium]